MAEEAAAPPALKSTAIHPKVGIPAIVGAIVAILMGAAKQVFDVDLAGYEANIMLVATAIAGYLTPS